MSSNLYRGPHTLVSFDGTPDCDALVNLTPHPIVVVGLPGMPDERSRAALARARELGITTHGYAVTVPSHGTVRLVESPSAEIIPRPRSGNASRFTEICGWVPDCCAPFGVADVSFGEVSGDLPPALPRESITSGWGDDGTTPPNGQTHTFTVPGHYRVGSERGPRVWFLVSLLTAMALRGRHDVLTTGPEIRDESGRILGCVGLRRAVTTGVSLTEQEAAGLGLVAPWRRSC